MDINIEASENTRAESFDTMARTLQRQLPRRRMAGLLAALAAGVFGINAHVETAAARRKRGKRYATRLSAEASKGTSSIPPNCIYVCCDGTCDSWKMCMKCVKWPTGTTTTIASS
jgi:hypothetical protein